MSHRIVLDRDAVRPQLPPYQEIEHPGIRDAAAAFDAAKVTLRERKQDVVEWEQTREAAEWRDAEAAEQARAAGKPEGKRSQVAEHDRKTDTARHELKIATIAEQRAFDELQAAVDAHLEDWSASVTGECEQLSKAWSAAVATLEGLNGKLATAHRVRSIATGLPGVQTDVIKVAPRDVQGLDFAPTPEGSSRAPGSQQRAAKGIVGLDHVLAELREMGQLPEHEHEHVEPREMEPRSILGHTVMVPKQLDPEKRDERLRRAESRKAEREGVREAVHAEIFGGES